MGLSSFVLFIFFVSVVLYAIGAFFILYHLIRFGVGVQPKKFALVFLVGSVVLFFLCTVTLAVGFSSLQAYDLRIKNIQLPATLTASL